MNIDFGSTPPADTSKLWVPLASKPDTVNVGPAIEFGNQILSVDQTGDASNQKFNYCYHEGKIYCFAATEKDFTQNIAVYDIENQSYSAISTNDITFMYNGNPYTGSGRKIYGSAPVSYNGDIYLFGGFVFMSYQVYSYQHVWKLSIKDMTITNVGALAYIYAATDESSLCNSSAVVVGNMAYIFGGGLNSYSNRSNVIQSYNLDTNVGNRITNLPYYLTYTSSVKVGNYIYCVGGNGGTTYDSSGPIKKTFRFNISTNAVETMADSIDSFYNAAVISYGQYIYCFGGSKSSIQIYDTVTNSWSKHANNLPTAVSSSFYCAALSGNTVYLYTVYISSNTVRRPYKIRFVIYTPLENNTLFLQSDFSFSGLWEMIVSSKGSALIKVIKAWLGNTDNQAELVDAYLYDTTTNKWTKLDGSSTYQDMLNALNIMGVN